MIVVSDSSPLISLHKIGLLALLPRMFGGVVIPPEVFAEVAVDGYGRPGSIEVLYHSLLSFLPSLVLKHRLFSSGSF